MKLTDISPAIALTPLDGRYHQQTAPLVEYLSEPALNRERMRVEVEWMILLANGFEGNSNQTIVPGVKPLTDEEQAFLRAILRSSAPRVSRNTPPMRQRPIMM